jgi:hypothetical protein
LARERARADAEFYTIERKAAANKLLLTKEYLELKRTEAIQFNSKVMSTGEMCVTGNGGLVCRSILAKVFRKCSTTRARHR